MIGLTKLAPGPGNVELAERPAPAPGAGQLQVDVSGCGVCGTDLHIEAGEYAAAPPVTIGHEVAGVVAALGAGVEESWLGARVACEPCFSTCERCAACRDGRPNHCRQRLSIGTHVDGGFAPRLIAPERGLHRLPETVELVVAPLLEPLAVVCQCLLDPAVVTPGDRVLVVGPGPIGLLAAQVAAALGGEVEVAGLPPDADRLRTAAELGFGTRVDPAEPESVDVVVEATGSAGGIGAGFAAARRGGRFALIGLAGGPVEVPLDLATLKELGVSTSFGSTPRSWRRALDLAGRGQVRLEPLVSERAPLEAWPEVFAELRAGRRMKVILEPTKA
ncbi:MAG TPA: alcohol dehydrogenase catalytic domain-containing protein [Solirubrobacterales bacterium]|nr:alcohol dehydrogenase catalytic domain-containing protein [Solirubrobacterales bacterium]